MPSARAGIRRACCGAVRRQTPRRAIALDFRRSLDYIPIIWVLKLILRQQAPGRDAWT